MVLIIISHIKITTAQLMPDERFLTFSLNEKIRLSNLKRLVNGVRQPINRNDGHAFELGTA